MNHAEEKKENINGGTRVGYKDVLLAHHIIKPYVVNTPLLRCSTFDVLSGRNVFIKAENLQTTGSFKYRGAVSAVARVAAKKSDNANNMCVVTHSSGNHGQAVAKAAGLFNVPAYIVMPTTAPECKKKATKAYGGIVVECEPTETARMTAADKICKEKQACFISSSQTHEVIAGQGTMAIEMLEKNPDLDAIVTPVGGGGMLGGVAIAAKHIKPSIKVYAAEPELGNDCYLSKLNGRRTPLNYTPDTIADGARVNIGKTTWPIINKLVDGVITVTEDEILNAVKLLWERAKLVAEPTAGLGIAAVIGEGLRNMEGSERLTNVGVIVSGGNVDLSKMFTLL